MRIAIDCRLWDQGGVGRYIRNLVYNLVAIDTQNTYTLFTYGNPTIQVKNVKCTIKNSSARWHSVTEQTVFLYELLKERYDVVHFPYFSHPILYNRPFVITLHDTTPLTHATGLATTRNKLVYAVKKLGYRYTLNHALTHARGVLVPTKAVADTIQPLHKNTPITVTYEGVDEALKQAHSVSVEGLPVEYILYVGNMFPHKNIPRLLTAFSQLKHRKMLVMVGPYDAFALRMRQRAIDLGISDRVVFLHNVSDGELKYVYTHASALVFPSLTEGFGLPVLEAAYFNCPLLLSDIPAFREIAPPNAQFFNPHYADNIREKLEIAGTLKKQSYPKLLMEKFSFTQMAQNTLQVYHEAV